MSKSSYTFSSTSYSSSISTSTSITPNGGQGQTHTISGHAYSTEQRSDPSGTKIRQTAQNMGGPAIQETRYYDETGCEVPANASGGRLEAGTASRTGRGVGGVSGRMIEDVTGSGGNDGYGDAGGYRPAKPGESEADTLYRERMEDEYAKREGGA